jgi:hypothetical protein
VLDARSAAQQPPARLRAPLDIRPSATTHRLASTTFPNSLDRAAPPCARPLASCGATDSPPQERESLARYADDLGRTREVVSRSGAHGSVLVVDRDAATRGDQRLVAHLGADEPEHNAVLVCASYIERLGRGDCRCRALTPTDLITVPLAEARVGGASGEQLPRAILAAPADRGGGTYHVRPLHTSLSIPELRWRRRSHLPAVEERTVSVRAAIGSLESYEPVRTITAQALASAREQEVSTAVLRAELVRVQLSPIVLNRGLREAARAYMRREGVSLSEIAIRCGRVKRDAAGNESGETSWLARRLGLAPEGGRDAPTPWIHTDVLALIARRGLGLSPREVEAS